MNRQTKPIEEEHQAAVILVVDDEPDIRTFVRLALEDEGYQVVTAANGREALEALRTIEPGLILLDLRMPGMDGSEFVEAYHCRAAQESPPAVPAPIIVLTASRVPEDEPGAVGATGVLRKPFAVAQLLERVAQHVRLASGSA